MADFKERRVTPRTPTERQVAFVAVDGSTLLQRGTVVDISGDGLRLKTRQPPPVGKIVELEIDPKEDTPNAKPKIVRGRVAHVEPGGNGEFSVGIRLRYKVAPAQVIVAPGGVDAGAMIQPVYAQSALWGKILNGDWRSWGAAIALLLLLLLLLLAWPDGDRASRQRYRGATALDSAATKPAAAKPIKPVSPNPASGGNSASGNALANDELAGLLRDRKLDAARRKADALIRDSGVERLWLEGVTAALDKSDAQTDVPPTPRRSTLFPELEAQDTPKTSNGGQPIEITKLDLADLLKPQLPANNTGNEKGADAQGEDTKGVRLFVDKRSYAMTVFRDGNAIAQFPISHGANDSTPEGEFTIFNKLRDPDWYNKGETIPHGDPRNPLGASWMGFAKDGKPVSYGIHPVSDDSAVGKPNSRGCICLTPADAETLFRLIPVGAKVSIR